MNKISLLTLALIIALPGCGNKNKPAQPAKKSTVAKYMVTEVDVTRRNNENGDEDTDEYGNAKEFDFDAEYEDGDEEEDDEEDLSLDGLEGLEVEVDVDDIGDFDDIEDLEEDDQGTFRWIDAQTDDEFKTLYFSFNHYGIKPDQKEAVNYDIEQVKQLLSESGTSAQPTVVIEGHACQEGTPAYNVALSEKRAKIVADYFVAAGVPSNSIKVVGRGQECPAVINGKAVNGSREDRAPNRRVEVRVIYT